MNNEPVAWMNEHGEISQEEHWAYPTPLYTHPADLTDEEIDSLWELYGTLRRKAYLGEKIDWVFETRAILRKVP